MPVDRGVFQALREEVIFVADHETAIETGNPRARPPVEPVAHEALDIF